jgi:hypothetical protein
MPTVKKQPTGCSSSSAQSASCSCHESWLAAEEPLKYSDAGAAGTASRLRLPVNSGSCGLENRCAPLSGSGGGVAPRLLVRPDKLGAAAPGELPRGSGLCSAGHSAAAGPPPAASSPLPPRAGGGRSGSDCARHGAGTGCAVVVPFAVGAHCMAPKLPRPPVLPFAQRLSSDGRRARGSKGLRGGRSWDDVAPSSGALLTLRSTVAAASDVRRDAAVLWPSGGEASREAGTAPGEGDESC